MNLSQFTLLAVCLIVFATPADAGDRLSAAEMIAAIKSKTIEGSTASGVDYTAVFAPDGTVTFDTDQYGDDTGNWHVKANGQLCTQYQNFRQGMERCLWFEKEGKRLKRFYADDGERLYWDYKIVQKTNPNADTKIREKITAEQSSAPTTNPTNTLEDRLKILKSLLEKGLITKEEAAQKRKALAPSRDDIGKRFELAFWASIKDSTNAANFWDYLEKFPNGTFVGLASRRIETLKKNADNLRREDELSDWTRLKNSTNPDDFRAFLEQYPNSMFASLAKRRMGRREETSDSKTTKRVALPVQDDRARSGHLRISIEEVEKDGNLEEFLSQFPPGKVRSDIEEQMKAWLAIKDSDLLEIDAELFLQRFRTGIVADRVQLELDDIHQEIDNADHGP